MTNRLITLNVNLTLIGPVLTQSSSVSGYGVDVLMAKNSDGKFYLPGTLIKGRLLQAWKELSETLKTDFAPDISVLLGNGSGNRKEPTKGVLPNRGRLLFSDFVAQSGTDGKALFRIKMDEQRGAVKTGAYLVMEAPFAAGEEVVFNGTISFFADAEKDKIKKWIDAGLRWNMAFGAERTVGFGRLKSVSIKESPAAKNITVQTKTGDSFIIAITPNAPFCIANRQLKENLFESGEIIPGGVIKGTVASTWRMMLGKGPNVIITTGFDDTRKELSESFDKIRFTHAFPSDKGTYKRPTVYPYSLVKGVNGTLKDVALLKTAEPVDNAAPSFFLDWKESGDVTGKFGWPDVTKELRVRTALDSSKRKSKDEQLFAYEMIVPAGLVWLADVDLSRVKSGDDGHKNAELRNTVKFQLIDVLLHGLQGFGKTKTTADIAVSAAIPKQQTKPIKDGCYIITLQTAAILCKPDDLNEKSGAAEIEKEYRAVWSELSGNTLELDNYFARQSLAGGYYLHKRFQDGKDYSPWLLTDAGSVFVLKATGQGDAATKIMEWLQQGLPLPNWAKEKYSKSGKNDEDHWKNCPYIPENGYGEIRLTTELLDIPAPAKEEKQ